MSNRWVYTTISFSIPDAPDTEETEAEAPLFLSVKNITEGGVLPDAPFTVRVYYYTEKSTTLKWGSPALKPVSISSIGSGIESITETVQLTWGEGSTQYMNTDGVQSVIDDTLKNNIIAYKEVTYDVNYQDFELSASDIDTYQAVVYFGDKSSSAQVSFQVVDASTLVSPSLSVKSLETETTLPGDTHTVRVYFYHPDNDPILTSHDPNDTITITPLTPDTEEITEEINLAFGRGNLQYTDINGEKEIYIEADKDLPISSTSHTYTVNYKDYELSSPNAGTYPVAFYFTTNSITQYSFSVVDYSEEDQQNAYLSITPLTSGAVEPNANFDVKAYYYFPSNEIISTSSASSDNVTITKGSSNTESITETVALQWGKGSTSKPDTNGNQTVYVAAYENSAIEYTEVTYSVSYTNYALKSPDIGSHVGAFYYDKNSVNQVNFNVAAGGDKQNYMSIKSITSGAVAPSADFDIRIYYYTPDSTPIVNDVPPNDNTIITADGSGLESITETVKLSWGNGNTSLPDTNGETAVYDITYENEPLAYKDIAYDVNYKDYSLKSATDGQHNAVFYFDGEVSYNTVSFTVDSGVSPTIERAQTLRFKDTKTEAWLEDVVVQIAGVGTFISDSLGRINTTPLIVGQSYDFIASKPNYQTNTLDNIANDSFTAV